MAEPKRPLEDKDADPVAQALARTLEPPALHPRRRTKRQKTQAPPPPVPDRPRQCHFLAPSKNKYCRLTTKLGNKFCGEHSMYEQVAPASNVDGDNDTAGSNPDSKPQRKRIPCPFDPSHTAWEDDLKTHLYKCNARPKEGTAHFKADINLSLPRPETVQTPSGESMPASTVLSRDMLGKLSKDRLMALIQKIQDLHAKYVPEIRTMILDHPALDERKKNIKNIKHAHQQASLLGHMKRLSMLADPTTCFIEFGAGRGELSNYLKIAMDDEGQGTFILVDRTPPRNKFDSQMLGLKEIKSLVKRHTMDIKDLVLEHIPELRRDVTALEREVPVKEDGSVESDSVYVEKKPVVALSKHLCGGATDITLKCLSNYQDSERSKSPLPSPVKGILIALCCHQLCHHYMYPNQKFLKEIGVGPEDFAYLTRMSSWAVCVNQTKTSTDKETSNPGTPSEKPTDSSNGDDEHSVKADAELDELGAHIEALDGQAREKLGLQCKRLLDIGRVKYLQEHGFEAELVYYVDKETSLENLALMAVPQARS
ncbi:hypothetical protein BGW38_003414 [Lunasporangiospora selenospora]|uniref:tRNA:m(4)X modification enzyme TRM13 n=1 Tax=Lunasporangiospora selenospora TaxID=979761 RepID=A0A9P6KCV7_9FUNG|nr:hypothetical protein BGW38_003414 [Lunasporangiospora selenospora]